MFNMQTFTCLRIKVGGLVNVTSWVKSEMGIILKPNYRGKKTKQTYLKVKGQRTSPAALIKLPDKGRGTHKKKKNTK